MKWAPTILMAWIKESKDPWDILWMYSFSSLLHCQRHSRCCCIFIVFRHGDFYMPEMGGYFSNMPILFRLIQWKRLNTLLQSVFHAVLFYLRAIPDKFAGVIAMGSQSSCCSCCLGWIAVKLNQFVIVAVFSKKPCCVCSQFYGIRLFGYSTCNTGSYNPRQTFTTIYFGFFLLMPIILAGKKPSRCLKAWPDYIALRNNYIPLRSNCPR